MGNPFLQDENADRLHIEISTSRVTEDPKVPSEVKASK